MWLLSKLVERGNIYLLASVNYIFMNKTSGGDGIPAKLFKILENDAVKVLQSVCQEIWEIQQ